MSSLSPIRAFHFSNLLTYLSILSAFAMVYTVLNFFEYNPTSVLGIGLTICFVCDLFDGKFARLFKSRPEIAQKTGGQLDSLSDAIAFGFAPAVCLMIATRDISIAGSAFIFVIANITRLAFFNVYSSESKSFVGLPTTLAGLFLAISIIFLNQEQTKILALVLIALSILMVAPIKIPRPGIYGYVSLVILAAANFAVHYSRL